MEWEEIAVALLDKKLYLSALELYYELLEHNHEINSLRDFFSNPGNFETFYNIPRSTSLQTFDSLDLVSRYSDDDPVNVADERVTVLEFELRKAQDTINALRGTLTSSAAPEHKERNSSNSEHKGPILPYERRCLNFLISEHLLTQNCKLTAITLSEESGDQDLEDWEDVGLNCPRPPSLLGIYRTSDHHQIQSLEEKCKVLENKCSALTSEMNASISQITQLKKLLSETEESVKTTEKNSTDLEPRKSESSDGNVIVYFEEGAVKTKDERNRRQTSDCSVITQDSSDKERCQDAGSAVGSMTSYSTNDDSLKVMRHEVELSLAEATRESPVSTSPSEIGDQEDEDAGVEADGGVSDGIVSVTEDEQDIEERDGETLSLREDTVKSISPVQDAENNPLDVELKPSEVSPEDVKIEESPEVEEQAAESSDSVCDQGKETPVFVEEEQNENISSKNTTRESSDVEVISSSDCNTGNQVGENISGSDGDRTSPETAPDTGITLPEYSVSHFFANSLKVLVEGAGQCRLSEEISHISDDPILVMGRCLPHIMPHVLLNKREELLPVILCLAVQHPNPTTRDSLLHLLFNLVKKPDFDQRQIIRAGCEAFARSVDRRRLEEELLPQCWEQIADKFVERRLLVAETCGSLSVHFSVDVCSSLILSILKQVLDDKDESVRESAVKNLSLVITRIYNEHKASDLLQILRNTLHDSSSKVQQTSLRFYLPALSCWLLSRDHYLQTCYNMLLQQLLSSIQSASSARHIAIYLQSLNVSNVFVLAGMLKPLVTDAPADAMSQSTDESHLGLLDPCVILSITKSQYTSALSSLNTSIVQQSLPESVQIQTEWYRSTAVPCLVECIKSVKDKSLMADFTKLLAQMQMVIGRTFVQHVVRPVLLEHVMDARVLPVYCAGILAANEEDRAELKEFLGDTLNQYAHQYLDVGPLTETFAELSLTRSVLHILVNVLNTALREATNPHMKGIIAKICKGLCDCADPQDIVTHVMPILTRLANDPDVFVQTSTVISFAVMLQRSSGSVSSIREQLDKFISESVSSDVHVMMCELIESFTLVLPLCNPDIQRDFLIPRLATIGVSNSAITNKTKRRDITERLILAYKAILCCYISTDTIEHYIVPGLQALLTDAQEVVPDKQPTVDIMLREVLSKTSMASKDQRPSNAFGSKMSGFFKKK
ncbi:RAB11-binding protein RELCH-like isoform X3 [Bolinopsis microptera]|uniref:RAB11-binding protein RELCH-like isoform X3 n=1 Tax=Bolinopsis microptera TaxID=2820187 RepID=UPI003078A672